MLPVKISLNNFFSHKDSDVDFKTFDSCLLIGNTEGDYSKSNGSGKSAIFESILWCLFNKSRAAMMDDIIRWGERDCSVEFEFYHEKILYKVIRTRNRISSTSNVELYKQGQSGDWRNISGSTSGETNNKIESIIKLDNKTFINSVYFRQNDISEFAESEPSRKKEILKGIVDISRWDEYEKSSKKVAKELSSECGILRSKLESFEKSVLELKAARDNLEEENECIESLSKKKITLSKRLDIAYQKYLDKKSSLDTDSYDSLVIDVSSSRRDLSLLEERKKGVVSDIKAIDLSMLNIKKDIDESKNELSEIKIVDGANAMLESLSDDIITKRASLETNLSLLNNEKSHSISGDKCNICGQGLTEDLIHEVARSRETSISAYKALIPVLKNDIKRLEDKIFISKEDIKNNSKIESESLKIESLSIRLSTYEDSVSNKNALLKKVDSNIEDLSDKLRHNKNMLDSLKDNDFKKMGEVVSSIKNEISDISLSLNDKNREVGILTQKILTLTSEVDDMKSYRKELKKKQKSVSIFEKLSKMLGKGGIQTILLDSVIEDLEITANKILASICNEPASIVLETQRLGADGSSIIETLDLKVRKDGHLQNFKSLSGGEKFRISLALRIALSDISSRYGGSSLEFLLLDEVNSPLDRYGVETLFVNVIKSLEQRYKILVITHDESLKEKFNNVINITKINGDSEVSFTTR